MGVWGCLWRFMTVWEGVLSEDKWGYLLPVYLSIFLANLYNFVQYVSISEPYIIITEQSCLVTFFEGD